MSGALRFVAQREDVPAPAGEGDVVVVLDPAWTVPQAPGASGSRVLASRDLVAGVTRRRDLFTETTDRLDAWAREARIAERMTLDGISFWYMRRIGHWWWLHVRLLWTDVVDRLVTEHRPDTIELPADADGGLRDAIELVATRDGIALRIVGPGATAPTGDVEQDADDPVVKATATPTPAAGFVDRIRAVIARRALARRRAEIDRRLAAMLREPPRLLVLVDPASNQRVDMPEGPIVGNPFLEPVIRALGGTALDPIRFELGSRLGDPGTWERLSAPGGERALPGEILARDYARPDDAAAGRAQAEAMAADVAGIEVPLAAPLGGGDVDLGPRLVTGIVRAIGRSSLPGRFRDLRRIRRFLAALRPAGLFLINEYSRTEWLGAARAEGIPVVAVQHGIIHRHHPGYIHARPDPAMPLPDRLYLFGEYERRLLTTRSVQPAESLRVVGSPRLDVAATRNADAATARLMIRRQLGVADGDRMLVISTTFGPPRALYTPASLAALLGGDLAGVHLVVKTHPNEPDDGLHARLIEGLRAALGAPPARLTVIQAIDLYALLAAADAHLGIFSTVLTEAVAVGTPNLLAVTQATNDLIGYVEAGVAVPVRDPAELRMELDRIAAGATTDPDARSAFIADHFEPGVASARIRDDLVAWLAGPGNDA